MKGLALYFFLLSSLSLFPSKLKEGNYRGSLFLNESEGIELPFNFEIKYNGRKPRIIIRNAEEKIIVTEIKLKKDSVFFKMPVFDTEFRCKKNESGLEGVFINHYRTDKNIIRFSAIYGENRRFLFMPGKANPYFEGKWEVTFSPGTKDSSQAIGVFHHLEQSDYINGTFLSETGDYRYLEGMKHGNKMYLSSFDGSNVYLFTAEMNDQGELQGKFYSGAHWQENWKGRKNENFKLKNPEEISFVKDPNQKISFSFPDLTNKKISLDDKKFENKPVIIQAMGSWCPNCMDESAYLSEVYKKYKKDGLEIIALSFEKTNDFEKAKSQVERLVKKFGIDYTVLLTLQSGKEKASETLSFLNKINCFPTTIFLNKNHKVVKIHSGFSGPATGNDYLSFKEDTEALIRKLVNE